MISGYHMSIGHEKTFKVQDVVAIDPFETIQASSLLLKKYLNTVEIHYRSNRQLIQLLEINHLDGQSFSNFRNILTSIHHQYFTIVVSNREFVTFYNKILSKLFDFYVTDIQSDRIHELAGCLWLGINETDQSLEWKAANEIYYIEDKPAYDILPDTIKKLVQPHFTNRDKNRFGQIGKKIGLNFKETIEQKLVNVKPIKNISLWDYIPAFFESIALAEVLLETNLDTKLEELKSTKVSICEDFEIMLFKDDQHISTVSQLSYKIEKHNFINIYIRQESSVTASLYANILHDLFVEVLSRDLHTVRLTLNDFYSRSSKQDFIGRYEVSQDRIDEIEARVKGFSISKIQSFWLGILLYKNIPNPQLFFIGSDVNYDQLLPALKIGNHSLQNIDYDRIHKVENLELLQQLFENLNLDVRVFNELSEIKIDFRDYFVRQLSACSR